MDCAIYRLPLRSICKGKGKGGGKGERRKENFPLPPSPFPFPFPFLLSPSLSPFPFSVPFLLLCSPFFLSHETQTPGFHPAQELHYFIFMKLRPQVFMKLRPQVFMKLRSLRFYVSDYPLLWFWMDRAIQASTFLELGNPSFGGSLQFQKIIITPKKILSRIRKKYCRGLDREVTGSTNPYNIQQPSNLIRWGVS